MFGYYHLGCITMMPVASCIPFPISTLCDDMLAMLVCATRWLSMYLYSLAYMTMHESCLQVCHPYFNTMKLWTSDPNLHVSSIPLFACLLVCLLLVCLLLACLPYCLFTRILVSTLAVSIMLICFMSPSYALCIFSFHCLSVGFLSLPLHVHTWS